LHIDGVANAKQISKRAEVDLEMVRACLRVLKQHNVVRLIDMFCYSNRYEWTGRIIGPDTLHDAVEYVVKHTELRVTPTATEQKSSSNSIREFHHSKSPTNRSRGDNEASLMADSFGGSSLPNDMTMMKGASLTGSSLPNNDGGTSLCASSAMKHEDYIEIQNAIVEFYAACHRDIPIGEVWIALITKRQPATAGMSTISNTIHWKKVFRLIDHRRLIAFGLIHGYIRRFHNYPLLSNRIINPMDDDPSTPIYSNIQRQKSISSHDRIGRGSSHNSYSHHIKGEQAMRRTQSKRQAALLMDGMHCDDEIVCTVEMPLDEVMSMFPKNSVVSVFAKC
jgi:Nitrogen permease regulator 2